MRPLFSLQKNQRFTAKWLFHCFCPLLARQKSINNAGVTRQTAYTVKELTSCQPDRKTQYSSIRGAEHYRVNLTSFDDEDGLFRSTKDFFLCQYNDYLHQYCISLHQYCVNCAFLCQYRVLSALSGWRGGGGSKKLYLQICRAVPILYKQIQREYFLNWEIRFVSIRSIKVFFLPVWFLKNSGDEHIFCTTMMEKTVGKIGILNRDWNSDQFFF